MSSNNNNENDNLDKSTAKGDKATTPGSVAIAEDEAARLDECISEKPDKTVAAMEQDIAAKQMARSSAGDATQPGAVAQSGQPGRTELSTLESDVVAKQRTRPTGSKTLAGAFAEGPSPGRSTLSSLESDVAAKQKLRPTVPTTSPGAFAEGPSSGRSDLASLESDIAAKQRIRPGAAGVTPGAFAEGPSSGRTDLASLESDVAAKQKSRPTVSATSPGAFAEGPSSVRTNLASLESDVVAKQRAHPGAAGVVSGAFVEGSGGRNALASLESDVAMKQKSRPTVSATAPGAFAKGESGRTDLASLESDIVTKQRARPCAAGITPGAVSESDRIGLIALNSDVFAKTRAAGDGAMMPGARGELNTLEDAVAGKTRGEAGASVAGARAELNTLEDSVTAKMSDSASWRAHAQLRAMEDSVTAKSRGSASVTPGAHAELNTLEDSVVSKQSGGRQSEISRLDDRIAAKNGTPLMVAPMSMDGSGADLSDNKAKLDEPYQEQALHRGTKGDVGMDAGGTDQGGLDQGLVSNDIEYGTYGGNGDGLAVAFAVTEEDEDAFIPAAVEYDPDAKPPVYKNRRFRLYSFFAFIVLVVLAVATAIIVTVTKEDDYVPPSSAPTAFREGIGIAEQIERLVGSDVLKDENSAYSKALDWITFEDPMEVTVEDFNFLQRYIVAYFWYATTAESPWLSCNPPTGDETKSCFYQKLVSSFPLQYDPVPWIRWLSESNECQWAGVVCDDLDQIRAIEISKCSAARLSNCDRVSFISLTIVLFQQMGNKSRVPFRKALPSSLSCSLFH